VITLPVKVLLRCRTTGIVKGFGRIGPDAAPERIWIGQGESGGVELWFAGGKWRESGEPHPLDIVGFVNPDGSMRPLTNEFSK
jgi:hypothetical protein